MGRRGPPKKPTLLKRLTGNPGQYPLPQNEPDPRRGTPDMPDWLSDSARQIWFQLCGELDRLGLLTPLDGQTIAIWCDVWARWKSARDFIEEHGETYAVRAKPRAGQKIGDIKSIVRYPQANAYRQLTIILTRFQDRFGLSPSARASIGSANMAPTKDEYDRLMEESPAMRIAK